MALHVRGLSAGTTCRYTYDYSKWDQDGLDHSTSTIQIEVTERNPDSFVLKMDGEGKYKNEIIRVAFKTGSVEKESYHTHWWIPVPIFLGGKLRIQGKRDEHNVLHDAEFEVTSIDRIALHGIAIPAARLEGNWEEPREDWISNESVNGWYSTELGILLREERNSAIAPGKAALELLKQGLQAGYEKNPSWALGGKITQKFELDSSSVRSFFAVPEKNETWDLFICHAGEDKEQVARPLAEKLTHKGFRVWFDDFTLTLGDSLSSSIDYGLANSRFGVVVLSPSFFNKKWPRRELDGLTAREISSGKTILPVWHNIDHDSIIKYSPMLADKLGVSTKKGLEKVADEILKALEKGR